MRYFCILAMCVCLFLPNYGLAQLSTFTDSEKLLLSAVLMQDVDAMAKAVEQGANINIRNDDDVTPLMAAILKNDVVSTKALLELGADVSLQTKIGYDALWFASFHLMQGYSQENVIALLEHGADPNILAGAGVTPLFFAAKTGNIALVEKMLELGADPNLTKDGITALGAAVENGDIDIATLLLQHGASPTRKTSQGKSPLGLAYHYRDREMVDLLESSMR